MDNEKSDDYYVQKIRKDLEFMVEHMKNVDKEELELNEMLVDSMMFRMIQVSENFGIDTKQFFKTTSRNRCCFLLTGIKHKP